jgi:hypothetical protein
LLRTKGFSAAEIDAMDDVERDGMTIILTEFDGGSFDWETVSWRKPGGSP